MVDEDDLLMSYLNSDEPTGAEKFLAEMERRRTALPRYRKAQLYIRHRIIQPARNLPRRARWFIQRGRRGWSDLDAWGMADHIARINVEMLRYLQDCVHGYPANLDVDSSWGDTPPEQIAMLAEIDAKFGLIDADGMDRWKAILFHMEEGWKAEQTYLNEWDSDAHEEFKAMMPTYAEWLGGLWD